MWGKDNKHGADKKPLGFLGALKNIITPMASKPELTQPGKGNSDDATFRKRKSVPQVTPTEPSFLASAPRVPTPKRSKSLQIEQEETRVPAPRERDSLKETLTLEKKPTRSSDRLKKRAEIGEKPLFSPMFKPFGRKGRNRLEHQRLAASASDSEANSSESLLNPLSASLPAIPLHGGAVTKLCTVIEFDDYKPASSHASVLVSPPQSPMLALNQPILVAPTSGTTDFASVHSTEETEDLEAGFQSVLNPVILDLDRMVSEDMDDEIEGTGDGFEFELDPYYFIRSLPPLTAEMLHRPYAIPPKGDNYPRWTLVLDLDETLVHCTTSPVPNADFVFPVEFNGDHFDVYALKRPYLEEFLSQVSQIFEVVVFTASQQIYADTLLDLIDPPRNWIKHRLFRDSCLFVEGNYLKELSILQRDLATTIIVDNSPLAFGYQLDNGIPITSWYDDKSDQELLHLLNFLRALAATDDARPLIRERFQTSRGIDGLTM